MPITMSGNYIFAGPNDRCFKVASNFTNYLELGLPGAGSYYLEARIENDEFKINARLWDRVSSQEIVIRDNFPTGQRGVTRDDLPNGYRIKDSHGNLILGIEARDKICSISGRIEARDGTLVAESEADDFLVYKGPAVLGRAGDARGIVLDP